MCHLHGCKQRTEQALIKNDSKTNTNNCQPNLMIYDVDYAYIFTFSIHNNENYMHKYYVPSGCHTHIASRYLFDDNRMQ